MRSFRVISRCAAGVALVIVLFVFLRPVASVSHSGQGLTSTPDRISLHRQAQAIEKQRVILTLTNHWGRKLRIGDIRSGCACTVALPLEKQTLAPGDSVLLKLDVTPPQYGKVANTVLVKFSRFDERGVSQDADLKIPVELSGAEMKAPLITTNWSAPLRVTLPSNAQTFDHRFEFSTIEPAGSDPWVLELEASTSDVTATMVGVPNQLPLTSDTVIRHYTARIACPVSDIVDWSLDTAITVKTRTPSVKPSAALRIIGRRCHPPRVIPAQISVDLASDTAFPILRKVVITTEGRGEDDDEDDEVIVTSPLPRWLRIEASKHDVPRGTTEHEMQIRIDEPEQGVLEPGSNVIAVVAFQIGSVNPHKVEFKVSLSRRG